jgi:hypothetical protein
MRFSNAVGSGERSNATGGGVDYPAYKRRQSIYRRFQSNEDYSKVDLDPDTPSDRAAHPNQTGSQKGDGGWFRSCACLHQTSSLNIVTSSSGGKQADTLETLTWV